MGLSQPQLSRIIAKLEKDLGVRLLDRSVRRKSTWTPEARKLAEIYRRTSRGFEAEVEGLVGRTQPKRIAVGCLEGLIEHAAGVCHTLMQKNKLQTLELDVQDIDTLENLFLNGSLDVIYTCREIVRRKPKYSRIIATQLLEPTGGSRDNKTVVRSHYEHRSTPQRRYGAPEYELLVLSNSLSVRRHWLERFGGRGIIPSRPRKARTDDPREAPVFLFAADKLGDELWKQLSELSLKSV